MKFNITLALAIFIISTNIAYSSIPQGHSPSSIDPPKTLTIKVKGVTCSNDLKTISSNVEKLRGVNSCKALKRGATSTFEVKYNADLISEEAIHAAIEDTQGCKSPNDRPYKVKL